jgi:hydrogenase/urease accessory protein HupE
MALALLAGLLAGRARADELRPGYLDLRERAADSFAVLWRVPAMGERRLAIDPRLPPTCRAITEPSHAFEASFYTARWVALCPGGMQGAMLAVDGLATSATDVLVRIARLDGAVQVGRLTPEHPALVVAAAPGWLDTASTYFALGVEHILTGFDHLLFVLALMVLIRDGWKLVKTITAFTLAHSLTLAGASLGYIALPQPPVEACIALSIAFVACEIVKSEPGRPRLSERAPWVLAFSFGLLHGLGFAGALKEVGLPQHDLPLALLTFNLGVEAGQLIFVSAVLLALAAARKWTWAQTGARAEARLRLGTGYAIGILSAAWLVERLLEFA